MSLRSISRLLWSPNPTNLQTLARFVTASSPADEFHSHLRQNVGQLEKTLATVRANLDLKCVTDVIDRCDPSQAQMGLRFFVWAGLQNGYRHTPLAFEKACKLLGINRNPKIIYDVVEAYRAESCLVSVKTFMVILNLCQEAKLATEALWVLRKMSEFGLRGDSTTYNVVIRLFCRKGDMDSADRLMKEMTSSGNIFLNIFTLTEMVKGFCSVGRFGEAFRLFSVAKEQGCVLNTVMYTGLILGLCKSGDLTRALELLGEMERGGEDIAPNVVTYTTVIQGLCDKGRLLEAVEILDRMESRCCFPNQVTANCLIERFCKAGRVREVYKLIGRLVASGDISFEKCYSLFVIALMRVGRSDEAERVLRKMVFSGLSPDGLASSVVVKEICSSGRVLEGYRLCTAMEKIGSFDAIDYDLYPILLAGLCQQEHVAAAVELAELLAMKGIRPKDPYVESIFRNLKKS